MEVVPRVMGNPFAAGVHPMVVKAPPIPSDKSEMLLSLIRYR